MSKNPLSLELDDVVLVGEYVTPEGPYLDDYFIVVVDTSGQEYDFAIRDPEVEPFLEKCKSHFESDFELRLCSKTDFSSRVMHPKALRGKSIFEYHPVKTSLFRLIASFWTQEYTRTYCPEISDHLNRIRSR